MPETNDLLSYREIFSEEYQLSLSPIWQHYPHTYRAREMQIIGNWISEGSSGSVVGLPGSGRSTLLGFLCHRPHALSAYLTDPLDAVALIPVDLNIMPDNTLATFYRVILRAFYQVRHQFAPSLLEKITELYEKNEPRRDPFLPQSAILELLTLFQRQEVRVVWVMNHFDDFCQAVTPEAARKMNHTLRSLRENYEETLCYIMGMRQEANYLPEPAVLGPMYKFLDTAVCWVGPLTTEDGRYRITQHLQTAAITPTGRDITHLWRLTGGYPSLISVACYWWRTLSQRPSYADLATMLLAQNSVQHRLESIWQSLTQEEQYTLSELQKAMAQLAASQNGREKTEIDRRQKIVQTLEEQHAAILQRLQTKGICRQEEDGWQLFAELFAAYIEQMEGHGRGKIWLDRHIGEFYQGKTRLDNLAPLESAILRFFVEYPKERHTHSEIIEAAWPEETYKEGVSTETLYQHVRGLRRKVEPHPSTPVYILKWRGQPEGGYQFFPEGRPQ